MKRFLVGFLAIIGLMSILMFFGGIVLFGFGLFAWSNSENGIENGSVLEIQFEQRITETASTDALGRLFTEEDLVLQDLIDSIHQAKDDERIRGIFADVSGIGMGLSQLQEVRDALLSFQESGKPVVAFAQTFGELSPGNGAYYLATACNDIYLQPSGDLNLTGLYVEAPFIRGTFDLVGIEPEIGQRHEYKNAVNFYKERKFTEPHREAMTQLIDSIFDQMVAAIVDSRGMSEETVRDWVDRGPLLSLAAKEAGFVDDTLYRDQAFARMNDGDADATSLSVRQYNEFSERRDDGQHTIALIYGYGGIQRGASSYDSFNNSPVFGSDTVSEAIRDAVDNDSVEAIVFRVSSPGGSYIASDTVWHEVARAREFGKPIVVSMGDYAASGGYFVSLAADYIIAQPATLTGSIGVYGGKMVLAEVMDKVGVTFDHVSTGANAAIWSPNVPYTEEGWKSIDAFLDHVYDDFTGKVAEYRGLDRERVHELARGRVWTGEDALEVGLVDELGGLDRAFEVALELAELDPSAGYNRRVFPAEKSTIELLMEQRGFAGVSGSRELMLQWHEQTADLRKLATELGVVHERGVLETRLPEILGGQR